MDPANGYEQYAATYLKYRGTLPGGIGLATVLDWAADLPAGATVLDLGCGSGLPLSRALLDRGLSVYGVDAAPTMVERFRKNCPEAEVECGAVESSAFFGRSFDAVVGWGVVFLLPEETQLTLIRRVGEVLRSGGSLLFTAPWQEVEWEDLVTGRTSRSLGRETYREALKANGMLLGPELTDEGGNHYFTASKAGRWSANRSYCPTTVNGM